LVRHHDRFYLAMAAAAALTVVAGFAPTYFRPLAAGLFSATPVVHVHAAMFFAWILFFMAQPTLVAIGRPGVHRAIGYAGAVLAAGMVIIGIVVGLAASARGVAAGDADAKAFLMITTTDMLLFAVLVGFAVRSRRRPQSHKRLMLLATAALLPAAFGRLFFAVGIETPIAMDIGASSFLLAGIVHDLWSHRRVHSAYLWGGGLMVGIQVLRQLTAESHGWAWIADRILGAVWA
jgi:hypothetical protein